MDSKICSKCKQIRKITDFYKNKSKKSGYSCWYELCCKDYENKNKHKYKKLRAKYYQDNKSKLNKWQKIYKARRRKNDINFRILTNLRTRLNHAWNGKLKSTTTLELLGCSVEFLKKHLESQFTEGMSWDNYGDWHIDHEIPCANFKNVKQEKSKSLFSLY